jgi:hypothetical protein
MCSFVAAERTPMASAPRSAPASVPAAAPSGDWGVPLPAAEQRDCGFRRGQ